MEEINGKVYPMWSQFVEQSDQWKGGVLEDFGDSMDRRMGFEIMTTIIKSIELKPNGKDSAMFCINGEDFNCCGDVQFIGITAGEEGYITFGGFMGSKFRIKKPKE